jgi:NTE family protein
VQPKLDLHAPHPWRAGGRSIDAEGAAGGPQGQLTSASPAPSALAAWWRSRRAAALRLNLALQGGGAHGAFTWGVLDALIEDPRVVFEGLSGSSAGAMNAVVLADGWAKGGRAGAGRALADFWTFVGKQLHAGMVHQGKDEMSLSAASKWLATWAGYFSPSQLNPFDLNPLREWLDGQIDFERLRTGSPFKLFVGATQANTGKLRIFREHELTLDMLLASACLPKIHRPVVIDGQPYWDGGYSANPAVFPLLYDCATRDLLLVLLNPLQREGTPSTVQQIETRTLELAFSANFMREMQMFARAAEFSAASWPALGRLERRLQSLRWHMIDSSEVAGLRRTETQLLAYGPFLQMLREQGRGRALAWLARHAQSVGRRSTLDLRQWAA